MCVVTRSLATADPIFFGVRARFKGEAPHFAPRIPLRVSFSGRRLKRLSPRKRKCRGAAARRRHIPAEAHLGCNAAAALPGAGGECAGAPPPAPGIPTLVKKAGRWWGLLSLPMQSLAIGPLGPAALERRREGGKDGWTQGEPSHRQGGPR